MVEFQYPFSEAIINKSLLNLGHYSLMGKIEDDNAYSSFSPFLRTVIEDQLNFQRLPNLLSIIFLASGLYIVGDYRGFQ